MRHALVRRNAFWLVLSLVLFLVSAIGASLVQTGAGSVTIKDLKWETSSGRMINALLFKPATATADEKAPAIVVSHGWWNNREMQDANYVELARRGYVVMSIDMYGHGNSDPLPFGEEPVGGTGMYDAVKLIADLPYVDTERIGVTGHSNGARAANFSMALDNAADTPLISAIVLVDNDPVYTDAENDNAYFNLYGARDVAVVQAEYDEFFFRSYDAEGNALTPPREYITTPNAQSFLNFGADPTAGDLETRDADTLYTERIDGEEALRAIYPQSQTHPWSTISQSAVADTLTFFDEALGTPEAIEPSAQVWQWKELFTALGLVAFGIFLVTFARALLETRVFAGLKIAAPAAVATDRAGRGWFWGGLIVSALFSGLSYVALSQAGWLLPIVFNGVPSIVPQGAVFFIALWAGINGLFAIAVMTVSYLAFGRRRGVSLRDAGVLPGWKTLLGSVGLAAVVVASAFMIVFVLDYFFKTDLRWWVVAIKWFPQDKIWAALFVLPLFLVYFVANSVALNAFNRITLGGREWVNTAVLALFNALPAIVLVVAQYVTFFVTGELIPGFGGIFSIWLFPVILILAVSAVISRKIYRATNNPYIGGFINAAVVALMSASNSLIVV